MPETLLSIVPTSSVPPLRQAARWNPGERGALDKRACFLGHALQRAFPVLFQRDPLTSTPRGFLEDSDRHELRVETTKAGAFLDEAHGVSSATIYSGVVFLGGLVLESRASPTDKA